MKPQFEFNRKDPEYPELSVTDLDFLVRHTGLGVTQVKRMHFGIWKRHKGNALTTKANY